MYTYISSQHIIFRGFLGYRIDKLASVPIISFFPATSIHPPSGRTRILEAFTIEN